MYILGINCYMHDASACLLEDGRIVAFAEEERFNREKHTSAFPEHAIDFCLRHAGITIREIEHIAYFWIPWKGILARAMQILKAAPMSFAQNPHRLRVFQQMLGIRRLFRKRYGYRNRFHFVEHHLAHAASAFFVSPFEEAAILIVDCNGEIASTLAAVGRGNRIGKLYEIRYPDSIGLLYLSVTEYLGFQENEGEGKVMGLAPYGRPSFRAEFERILTWKHVASRRRSVLDRDRRPFEPLLPASLEAFPAFRLDLSYFDVHLRKEHYVSDKFIRTFGPRRERGGEILTHHKDVARTLQEVTEESVLTLAADLRQRTKLPNLCYSGGVALNCVANGKLRQSGIFDRIYIQPAAYDAGTSLGAALWVYHTICGKPRSFVMDRADWGPEYSEGEIRAEIEARSSCESGGSPMFFTRSADIAREVAGLLAEGKVVGWFQGRMEVGPRALGYRSILADSRRVEMKDILNNRVKHREPFRPFGPSIPVEDVRDYFADGAESPFMLFTFDALPDKRAVIPSVLHIDYSARVQTVRADVQPLYYRLLREFEKLTGVSVILNTSFNLRGEPIVQSPGDALSTFLRTEMDALAIGPFLVTKTPPGVGR